MALEEYKKKRNFNSTPEPDAIHEGENAKRFVVQRHRASSLHYDLRLEMEGVLKSWAVPKGPSMNPNDKRLAIQTEDHPVAYLSFEGTIPKGNYGAGKMTIWDRGTYDISEGYATIGLSQQYVEGNLKVRLFGKKIKGDFALVRTARGGNSDQWLLIKKEDSFATDLNYEAETFADSPLISENSNSFKAIGPDSFIRPMLASHTKKIFNDRDWLYELKWDGYRMMANIESGNVHLYSRTGVSYGTKFPSLVRELESIEHDAILDGEVVVVDKEGLPMFQSLQNYGRSTEGILRYYIFDMLFLNGHTMLDLGLIERKSLIPEVIGNLDHVIYCDHVEGMGTALYERAIDAGMEGVMAKRKDSTYSPGYRSQNWLKVKASHTIEGYICGYTDSVGGGAAFGSLIIGINSGDKYEYIGNCGSGFSASEQRELLALMQNLKIEQCPFPEKPNLKGRNGNWVLPRLKCRVKYSEMTDNGLMRHPVYLGLLDDMIPPERLESRKTEVGDLEGKSSDILEVNGTSVPLSNLEKVFWPEFGYTKYDLIDYYLNISEHILPYLIDRPQSLHRQPDGILDEGFYQKNSNHLPDWIKTQSIYSKSTNRDIQYLLCQNTATLLYMANLGCIEIHPWNSRIGNLDRPDYTIIDLDPSDKNTFEEVITVAQATKEVLDSAYIKGYCKTSGSRGLHIYIPLGGHYDYAEARDFTKLLCYFILDRTSGLTTMARPLDKRNGKIYLDYLQNRRGQTLAAPYCVRPRPGATVSAPLEWKEVKTGLRKEDFNIKTMPERLMEKKDIFIDVLKSRNDIEKAITELEKI